jgi:hypothetical protein
MKGKTMEKFEQIEKLYARRSELNLHTCTLEDAIANSSDRAQKLGHLNELRNAHYEMFMLEYEIKAVLEPDMKSIWNKICRR